MCIFQTVLNLPEIENDSLGTRIMKVSIRGPEISN